MSPSTEVRENREFASEIKFLVSNALADQIRGWARGRLAPDPNAAGDAYRVRSFAAYLMMANAKGFSAPQPAFLLRLRVGQGLDLETLFGGTLDVHIQHRELISVGTAKQGVSLEVAYEARLRQTGAADELVKALNRIEGVQSVQLERRGFDEE